MARHQKGIVNFPDLKVTNSIAACSAEGEMLLYGSAWKFPNSKVRTLLV
jgi:hypothetical protein